MAENKATRLSKIAREFNVGISTIVDFLHGKGIKIDSNPNTKISPEHYALLQDEYSSDLSIKKESEKVNLKQLREKKQSVSISDINEEENSTKEPTEEDELLIEDRAAGNAIFETESKKELEKNINVNVVGKIDLEPKDNEEDTEVQDKEEEKPQQQEVKKEAEEDKVESTTESKTLETQEEPPKDAAVEQPAAEEPKVVTEEKEETVKDEVEAPKEAVQEEKTSEPLEKEEDNSTGLKQNVESNVKVLGKIDLDSMNQKTRPDKKTKAQRKKEFEQKDSPKKEARPQSKDKAPVQKEEKVHKKPGNERKAEAQETPVVENKAEVQNKQETDDVIRAKVKKLSGPTVLGKIDLPKPAAKKTGQDSNKDNANNDRKKKRKRIRKETEKVKFSDGEGGNKKGGQQQQQRNDNKDNNRNNNNNKSRNKKKRRFKETEISEEDVQKQVKDTLARLTAKGKSKGAKHRRDKRDAANQKVQEELNKQEAEKNILKVTEFVSVNELASLMDVQVNEIIATCMNLGLIVSINQRLDAETMSLVADEFGFKVEFTTAEVLEAIEEVEDKPEDLSERPPIVTVMGHVDHGKTKLLDYVRNANVIAGEAGGITQHIGAYGVKLADDKRITFLDTPGHEAFTAMRARGAQVTDVAIIVIAADDGVMPQTKEAINHAQAAGVPMIFAINKIDMPTANPDKIKAELANLNILVEDWGGKFQSQEVSAKNGLNIDELLEKVLLEAELLELKANPAKAASGTVVESSLDKGRGYIATILVQTGTLKVGDIVLAGNHYGRVKAMYNERNKPVELAGPSTPVLILGLDGAPQAGDKFNVMDNDREAREIANKRDQLQREQRERTQKHITLDEIGRRIAIGNFQELNIIVKGDVDGSVEALSDSLIKLSNEEIQVRIISKAVGQISEADVYLAAASNAIIIGFQVRPSLGARKLAEKEEIDIRLYSIIYDAIEEVKSAMEGMLSPEIKEEIIATLEIQETFKITKVGTVAGCMVREGKIKRDAKIRVIRDGIVIYTGELGSLKRFKDDAKEVVSGLECGLNIVNYN
ncbi:MAG: translation initiation factor IF-2, partial [Bacteroidales bacterium]|nr:translation initiation factor IF-2 [Bacteroidales bacterium]